MQALILEQQDGKTLSSVQTIDASQLPQGDVTVDVQWSSLNYKDALAITGKGKIIRNFPMIPGIDFAGFVHSSEDPRFHAGQQVLLTGWGVGKTTGAVWRSALALKATGWWRCLKAWMDVKPW